MVFELTSVIKPGHTTYETIEKIGAINSKALSRLTELHLDLAGFGIETTMEQTKLLTDLDNYADLYSLESDIATRYLNRLMEVSQRTTGVLVESGDEYLTLIERMLNETKQKPVTVTKKTEATNNKTSAAAKKTTPKKAAAKRQTASKAG